MAKILYIVENLSSSDPFSLSIAKIIEGSMELGNEVSVFTSFIEHKEIKLPVKAQVFRPFKKWNWMELPQAAALFFQIHPDIVHIIQPRQPLKVFNLLSSFARLVKLIGSKLLFSLHDTNLIHPTLRNILKDSDGLSFMYDHQEFQLRSSFPNVNLFPLRLQAFFVDSENKDFSTEFDKNLLEQNYNKLPESSIFYIPLQFANLYHLESLISHLNQISKIQNCSFQFSGFSSSLKIHERYLLQSNASFNYNFLGNLSWYEEKKQIESADFILLSCLKMDWLQLARLTSVCPHHENLLILNNTQFEHSIYKNNRNPKVLVCEMAQLKTLMELHFKKDQSKKYLKYKPAQSVIRDAENLRSSVVDLQLNQLSRVYFGILQTGPRDC